MYIYIYIYIYIYVYIYIYIYIYRPIYYTYNKHTCIPTHILTQTKSCIFGTSYLSDFHGNTGLQRKNLYQEILFRKILGASEKF